MKLLDLERPAFGDLLEVFILRAVAESTALSQYGFLRTGPSGFGLKAVLLVQGILKSIAETTNV